ncbi:hypothetical protein [Microterricola gilva]|uniref:hypothetical protein n=1 Tax=Microterricola gilva TaxID=393267 RepID=UPI0013EED659|nr:hypothetical protein [Microterricola gilva]
MDPVTQEELAVPWHATAERAIDRAAKKRAGQLRSIRLFPEYCRTYPLWEDGGDNYTLAADDLGLSAELGEGLRAWLERWHEECLDSSDWSSEQARLDWLRDGAALCERLQFEVWEFAEVVREF